MYEKRPQKLCKYILVGLLVSLTTLEIIKYFVNFISFYSLFCLQIAMIVAVIVLLCLKIKHKKFFLCFFVCVLVFLLTPICYGFAKSEPESDNFNYVVHAAGGIDGKPYLNCREGFLSNVQQGQKYMEIDFLYTKDNKVVASHVFEYFDGYNLKNRPTFDEFQNFKIEGKYTGITYDWLLDQLETYPNVYVVFDTKENCPSDILQEMVDIAKERHFDFELRFIIQVYSKEDYQLMKDKFNFQRNWYTNYKSEYSPREIKKYFGNCEDVDTIVLFVTDWWVVNQTGIDLGKDIAVHTANKTSRVKFLATHGVDYIFTDAIK